MEKYKGIIWIKNTSSGSKSDGNKAYFIDTDFNHFQLSRKGVYEINDAFFTPYNLKTVEVTGEIQKQKWIIVDEIEYFETPSSLVIKEEDFVFKNSDFPNLINSEGSILNIVEQKFVTEEGIENYRLWLKAYVSSGVNVYVKVNETALLFFFQGRLSVKELFLLRNDETYVIEEIINKQTLIKKHYYSEEFDTDYLSKISCAEMHYYSISKSMRLENPYEDIMKKLELYYINSHESQQSNK